MALTNDVHVAYGIGLVPIQFYLLNRHDSKKLVEYCLKEGWIIEDLSHIGLEKIKKTLELQDIANLSESKPTFIHIDRTVPIVNVMDKGLMAVIEILVIGDE